MPKLKTIGVLAHPKRPKTAPVAQKIVASLGKRGIASWLHTAWDETTVTADVQGADMVIAIGGDGAMLQAGRVCAPYKVPVLGLNMGRLGFLTEIARVADWEKALDQLMHDDYWVETRMMITAMVVRADETILSSNALNDVVISGERIGHMVTLDLFIDGDWATTYNADALIVATPTGSTAYALSGGGPILPPDLTNILIVPIAPHLSMERSIVVADGARVEVRPTHSNRHTVLMATDGADLITLQDGDRVRVQACDYSARFVRMRKRNYFYRSLLDRLEPRVNRRNHDEDNNS